MPHAPFPPRVPYFILHQRQRRPSVDKLICLLFVRVIPFSPSFPASCSSPFLPFDSYPTRSQLVAGRVRSVAAESSAFLRAPPDPHVHVVCVLPRCVGIERTRITCFGSTRRPSLFSSPLFPFPTLSRSWNHSFEK